MQMFGLFLPCLFLVLAAATLAADAFSAPQPAASTPTPTYDPLAIPTLPENPTQEEIGEHVYYYNCMPCHGDQGQGLTEAWRQVWEEDHRDCWGRGCHGGRRGDEGFPIPTVVPAVMEAGDALPAYTSPQQLFDYLEATHPPQEPGRLSDDDTWALVAFLWSGNSKPTPSPTPSPMPATPAYPRTPPATATAIPSSTPENQRAPFYVCGVLVGMIAATLIIATRKKL